MLALELSLKQSEMEISFFCCKHTKKDSREEDFWVFIFSILVHCFKALGALAISINMSIYRAFFPWGFCGGKKKVAKI
jgi:hypothetical protein